MASLKVSVSMDNNSYEWKNQSFSLNPLKFASCALFSCYVNKSEALIMKSFCQLKRVRISRLESEAVDAVDSKLEEFQIDSRDNCVAHNNDIRVSDFHSYERRVNTVKKFHGVKNVRKSIKQNNVEKPGVPIQGISGNLVRDGQFAVDLDIDNIRTELSSSNCNVILEQLEKSNDDKALKFFEWMRSNRKLKKNVTAYNLILRVLGRNADWVGIEVMIKEMITESECELTYQIFNTLIYACYKNGVVDLGTRWFRMMLDYKVQPNVATFGMLMSLYQKGWVIKEAEFTFSKMRNLKIMCQSAYSSMITIYTRLGLYEKAEAVIGFLRTDQVVLNHENWLVLLNAYCQQGKLSDAEQIWFAMKEVGFSPSIVAYNTMITGYGRVSRMDHAESLFQRLKTVGLEPDETTYRSLIEGWGRAGNYNQAKCYYLELIRLGFKPNSSNLHTLIRLQAKHEDEMGAIRTIHDMMMIGCHKSSILGIVLQSYEKVNRLEKLPLILEGPLKDYVLKNQTSCAILVTAYVKNCLIDSALSILRDKQWVDLVFEDNLYHLIICSCKDLGHLENAIKIFTSMPKAEKPNLNIFCTMIDIFCKTSQFSEAENLYSQLKCSHVKLDMIAISVVVRMYVKSGSLREACSVLDIMHERKDIVPDVYLLRDMLRIYQRCGMNEKLAGLYYEVLKNSQFWDREMYNCIINCCARALPVDELSRLFDEMLRRGFSPNTVTVNVMLNAYGKSRLFKKARKLFWMAKKRGLVDVISYNTIIAAYGKNKYLRNMAAEVRKMQFEGFSVSLEAYNCMLDVYGKEREMDKFRSVLQRMKASNYSSDQYTYNILINIYGEQGWIEEVAGVLTELKDCGTGPDLCSYNTLIKAYGVAGMIKDAVALIKEMRGNGIEPDRITYTNLITAFKKNDMFLEAVKWSLWMKQLGL